jgi:tetratricopeptide (TPR) repeat protein
VLLVTNKLDFLIKYEYFSDAEEQLKSALEIKEITLAKNSVEFCDIYDNLASIWLQFNKLNNAKEYFEKSLQIRKIKFGESSIKIVPTLNNLSVVLFALQDNESAKTLLENALSIMRSKQVYGEVTSLYGTVLDNLAKYHYKTTQYQTSVSLFEKSLDVKEKCVGTKHTHYAIGLGQLGVAMATFATTSDKSELFEKSFSHLQSSIKLFESIIGNQHTSYAIALNNMGYHASVTDNWNDAINYLTEASRLLSEHSNSLATVVTSNLESAKNQSKLITPLFFDNFSLPTQEGNSINSFIVLILLRKH